jgi:CHAT domain-containing protein
MTSIGRLERSSLHVDAPLSGCGTDERHQQFSRWGRGEVSHARILAILFGAGIAVHSCWGQSTEASNGESNFQVAAGRGFEASVPDDCHAPAPADIAALQDAINRLHSAGDAGGEIRARLALATIDDNTAQYDAVIPLLEQAPKLEPAAKILALDIQLRTVLADALNHLHHTQDALDQLRIAIDEGQRGLDPASLADALRVRGETQQDPQRQAADFDAALQAMASAHDSEWQALRVRAEVLNDQGAVYDNPNDPDKPFVLFHEALEIEDQIHDCRDRGETLSNLASLDEDRGRVREALEDYAQALAMEQRVADRDSESRTLHALAKLHEDVGDLPQSLALFQQSLAIQQKVKDVAAAAETQVAIAGVYRDMKRPKEARHAYLAALPTLDQKARATALNNLATVEADLGDPAMARIYYRKAIAAAAAVEDASTPAYSAWGIGELEEADALTSYFRALRMAERQNLPDLKGLVSASLMDHFRRHRMPDVAIFFGKQAVDDFQGIRENMAGLNDAIVSSFLQEKAQTYRDLARLLIDEGRLCEAQQVLDLLKIQQYADYMGSQADVAVADVARNAEETQLNSQYRLMVARMAGPGGDAHPQSKPATDAQIATAEKDFDAQLARVPRELEIRRDSGAVEESDAQKTLDAAIARNPQTALVYTLLSRDRYDAIVITHEGRTARSYAISQPVLEAKCQAFLEMLRMHRGNTDAAAEELFDIVMGPVLKDLEQAGTKTIVWYLDGALRYIPVGALRNPRQGRYLIEDYSVANYTPLGRFQGDLPDLSHASGIAIGAGESYDPALGKLPNVAAELNDVVTDRSVKGSHGPLPGTILLDEHFTRAAMEAQVRSQTVVHIASHFVLQPGNDSMSFLLIGGKPGTGEEHKLSLADFKQDRDLRVEETELVALSACETGAENVRDDGVVMEGLSEAVLDKRAKAVISSLWAVNDQSTAAIMERFYQLWIGSGGTISKSEALRRAQLDLMRGNLKPDGDAGSRGLHAVGSVGTARFADPYYWAPFVLTGNWQ